MHEPVHGKFSVEVDGNIIVNRYAEGFNQAGIRAVTDAILESARGLERWALLQLPEASAGLTGDSVPEMMRAYNRLQCAGCIAVAIHDNSMFVRAGYMVKDVEVSLPFLIDKDIALPRPWLEKKFSTRQPSA
ncbi:hypothetical protein [Aestuariibacter salexigens]|uniref:hypothetical protein n=1 Tax=Aestuariibacter salexigens TaxID=226010 RepID=UPI00040485E1|nr:hypothetical protein [Aestuariibacter salexigens]